MKSPPQMSGIGFMVPACTNHPAGTTSSSRWRAMTAAGFPTRLGSPWRPTRPPGAGPPVSSARTPSTRSSASSLSTRRTGMRPWRSPAPWQWTRSGIRLHQATGRPTMRASKRRFSGHQPRELGATTAGGPPGPSITTDTVPAGSKPARLSRSSPHRRRLAPVIVWAGSGDAWRAITESCIFGSFRINRQHPRLCHPIFLASARSHRTAGPGWVNVGAQDRRSTGGSRS